MEWMPACFVGNACLNIFKDLNIFQDIYILCDSNKNKIVDSQQNCKIKYNIKHQSCFLINQDRVKKIEYAKLKDCLKRSFNEIDKNDDKNCNIKNHYDNELEDIVQNKKPKIEKIQSTNKNTIYLKNKTNKNTIYLKNKTNKNTIYLENKTNKNTIYLENKTLIESMPGDSIICWTDGGAKPNPGMAGAGIVICAPPPETSARAKRIQHLATLNKPLMVKSNELQKLGNWTECVIALGSTTNNHAELMAIGLVINIILIQCGLKKALAPYWKLIFINNDIENNDIDNIIKTKYEMNSFGPIYILTDSKYAIGALTNSKWKLKSNLILITEIKNALDQLKNYTHNPIHILKVPAHSEISGNERADQLASDGIVWSKTLQNPVPKIKIL
jgi:ribonuclease HI